MKMSLKEFRFQFQLSDEKIKNRLNSMINGIGRVYLNNIGKLVEIEKTNVLLVNVNDRDSKAQNNNSLGILGNETSGYIGGFGMCISVKSFVQLNDNAKRFYLLTEFQNSLFKFLEYYGYNSEKKSFNDSFWKVSNELDFWDTYSKEYISKNKVYLCQLEARVCWGGQEFRIRFKDLRSGNEERIYIGIKQLPFFSELNINPNTKGFMEMALKTPQIFDNYKWKTKLFEFYWGEEKYVFNTETKIVNKHS